MNETNSPFLFLSDFIFVIKKIGLKKENQTIKKKMYSSFVDNEK